MSDDDTCKMEVEWARSELKKIKMNRAVFNNHSVAPVKLNGRYSIRRNEIKTWNWTMKTWRETIQLSTLQPQLPMRPCGWRLVWSLEEFTVTCRKEAWYLARMQKYSFEVNLSEDPRKYLNMKRMKGTRTNSSFATPISVRMHRYWRRNDATGNKHGGYEYQSAQIFNNIVLSPSCCIRTNSVDFFLNMKVRHVA